MFKGHNSLNTTQIQLLLLRIQTSLPLISPTQNPKPLRINPSLQAHPSSFNRAKIYKKPNQNPNKNPRKPPIPTKKPSPQITKQLKKQKLPSPFNLWSLK